MIRLPPSVARLVASIRRRFSNSASAHDGPPPGWERRTTVSANGYSVSVEVPVPSQFSRGYVLTQHLRNVAEARRKVCRFGDADGGGKGNGGPARRPATASENRLLNEFLERWARR